MRNAAALVSTLESSDVYRLESVCDAAFESAMNRFVEWTDPGASFTEFVVVSHMDASDIDHIATFDSHFDAFDVTTLPYRA